MLADGRRAAARLDELGAIWLELRRAAAQRRPPGIAFCALSARRHRAVGPARAPARRPARLAAPGLRTTACRVYGSGGFCSYTLERLARAARRLGRAGHPAREDEARARAGARPAAARRRARGDRRRRALRRRERRVLGEGGASAGRNATSRRLGRALVRGARLVGGLRRAATRARALDARRRRRRVRVRARRLPQPDRQRRLPAGRRHALRRHHRRSCA